MCNAEHEKTKKLNIDLKNELSQSIANNDKLSDQLRKVKDSCRENEGNIKKELDVKMAS